jgi:hypothetical protein
MTVQALLQELYRLGMTITANGSQLSVHGPDPAFTGELIARIRASKDELLELLRRAEASRWRAHDWHTYFEERAAIREHDGGLTRREAEHLAFDDTLTQWLRLNPPLLSYRGSGCIHCGAPSEHSNTLVPVVTGGSRVWVHDWCWTSWTAALRQEARKAMLEMGISNSLRDGSSPGRGRHAAKRSRNGRE